MWTNKYESSWAWKPHSIKMRIEKMEARLQRNPKDYSAKYLLEKWRNRLVEVEKHLAADCAEDDISPAGPIG